jgi:16S rRNA (cytosine1402-N4)-methyltransferase
MQFDEKDRGFSFQKEGPLDMRMGQDIKLTAQKVVNTYSQKDLAEIFKTYGEERQHKKIAQEIVSARKKRSFKTTKDLSDCIVQAQPGRGKIHPATKVFQAIRIYINRELETIESSIKKAMTLLSDGGKIGVISFHSLEDRIVKNIFREASSPTRDLKGKVVNLAEFENLTKKPIAPSFRERRKNARARSAKLRFLRKKCEIAN